MYEEPIIDRIIVNIHPAKGYTHKSYGLLICDLVRHVAAAYEVEEDDVWEWVDKERKHHTIEIVPSS